MSSEISGYLQIVIGLIGIILTITNARSLVPDFDLFTKAQGAPPGLDNFSGFLRILIVILLLILMIFLLSMGFSVTLGAIYETLGAKYPILAASMTIISLIALALTVAMALYRYRFWVSGFIGSVGSGVAATVAAVNDDLSTFWTTVVIFLFAFGTTGVGTLITYLETDD